MKFFEGEERSLTVAYHFPYTDRPEKDVYLRIQIHPADETGEPLRLIKINMITDPDIHAVRAFWQY